MAHSNYVPKVKINVMVIGTMKSSVNGPIFFNLIFKESHSVCFSANERMLYLIVGSYDK